MTAQDPAQMTTEQREDNNMTTHPAVGDRYRHKFGGEVEVRAIVDGKPVVRFDDEGGSHGCSHLDSGYWTLIEPEPAWKTPQAREGWAVVYSDGNLTRSVSTDREAALIRADAGCCPAIVPVRIVPTGPAEEVRR